MNAGDLLKKVRDKKAAAGLDLLLIHCDLYYEIDFSAGNMGLIYVAESAEEAGYRTDIITSHHLYSRSLEQTRFEFIKMNPSIVGFYTISDTFEMVRDFAVQVKQWLPNAIIIAGGPLAAALGEKLLENSCFDMICTGEGEAAIKILCDAIIKKKGAISDAPGIIYRENGKITRGKHSTPLHNLDSLPFPQSRFFAGQQVFQVVSGRGCPYKCTFCFQAGHGLKFRFRSAKNVVDEITEKLDTKNFVGFGLIDDVFIMEPKRCMEIALMLQEYRKKTLMDFIFFCQGRVNILDKNPELIPALAKAGLAKMQLGIESGDPETLRLYKKGITVDQVRRTIKAINKAQSFLTVGGFILGGPFESEKTFKRTLDLAVELIGEAPGLFEASIGFMGAYPGTEIAEHPDKFGLKMMEKDFVRGSSLADVQMTTEALDVHRLRELKKVFRQGTYEAMERNLHRISWGLMRKHYRWASVYRIFSSWYYLFLDKLTCIKNYFRFLESPRFRAFRQIPVEDLHRYRPTRIQENRDYTADGRIILPQSITSETLDSLEEILAYELCSGKLTVKEAVERFCEERNIKGEENEVFASIFIPLFKKLDDTYRILFCEF